MTVYGCHVDDGSGDVVQLLDESGCAVDRYLLSNLEYFNDLMAGHEAHVFKYADRSNLYFQCQIRIEVKESGQECKVKLIAVLLIFKTVFCSALLPHQKIRITLLHCAIVNRFAAN